MFAIENRKIIFSINIEKGTPRARACPGLSTPRARACPVKARLQKGTPRACQRHAKGTPRARQGHTKKWARQGHANKEKRHAEGTQACQAREHARHARHAGHVGHAIYHNPLMYHRQLRTYNGGIHCVIEGQKSTRVSLNTVLTFLIYDRQMFSIS